MVFSIKVTVVLTAFLLLGVVLAGLIMQPRASIEVWDIKESDYPGNGSSQDRLTYLLGYAILAPSSHNTQPWRFSVNDSAISVFADKTRWLNVADADQRELFLSVGCALENLVVAAEHFGYACNVTYFPGDGDEIARVKLTLQGRPSGDERLFSALLSRHTNRNLYDSQRVQKDVLQILQNCSTEEDMQIYLTSELQARNDFRDLTVAADQVLFADINYKSELGHWLGQGMMGPTGVQALAAQMALVFLDIGSEQTRKDEELVDSTPVLGFIATKENDRISQVKAGRLFERVWLTATALGISIHPMSQALEVPEKKAQLSELLPDPSMYPQQTFRLGYSEPAKEHSPRRPLEEFLIK